MHIKSTLSIITIVFIASFLRINAQEYYIDPEAGVNGSGTIASPFNTTHDLSWQSGATYHFKRGTILRETIAIEASNITLDVYGAGTERASIQPTSEKNIRILALYADDITIKNLKVGGTDCTVGTAVIFNDCNNGSVVNCEIHSADLGLNAHMLTGVFTVENTEIHTIGQDGTYLTTLDSLFMDSCYVHDVNLTYNIGIYGKGNGDGIQTSNITFTRITNTVVDRRGTNNKFGIILQRSDDVVVENCTIYGSDEVFSEFSQTHNLGMTCLYLSGVSSSARVANCNFYSGTHGIWNQYSNNLVVDSCAFYGHESAAFNGAVNNCFVTNCLFYNPGYSCLTSGWSAPVVLHFHNNIFATRKSGFPIAASENAVDGQNNLYCPPGIRQDLYDQSPISGVIDSNIATIYEPDTRKFTVIDRKLPNQKYFFVNGNLYYEGYFLTSGTQEGVQLFFETNTEIFSFQPFGGLSYRYEFFDRQGQLMISQGGLSSTTNVFYSDLTDSIFGVNIISGTDTLYTNKLSTYEDEFLTEEMIQDIPRFVNPTEGEILIVDTLHITTRLHYIDTIHFIETNVYTHNGNFVTQKIHNETFVFTSDDVVRGSVIIFDTIAIADTISPKEVAYHTSTFETLRTLHSSHTISYNDTIGLTDTDMTLLEESGFKNNTDSYIAYLSDDGRRLHIRMNTDIAGAAYSAKIFSTQGILLMQHEIENGYASISVDNLPISGYLVHVSDPLGRNLGVKKFIIGGR